MSSVAIDGDDVHESRDDELHSAGVKKIIARAEHCEAGKGKAGGGHQNCTVDMAGVVAAEDEGRGRQLLLPFNRQPAIINEKHSAEALKHGTASGRRHEHAFRFARAGHRAFSRSGVIFLSPESETAAELPRRKPSPQVD